MAEEENNEENQEGAEPKKGKGKLLIIIIAAVVLLAGGGGAAFFLMSGGDDKKPAPQGEATGEGADAAEGGAAGGEAKKEGEASATAEGETKEDDKKEEDTTIRFGATYQFKPFHVNLGNPLQNHYIRLEVALEYKGEDPQKAEIEARLPQLRDAVLSVASEKTREFLLGPDGKDQLRREMLNRINQYMDRKVEAVYITDMLIE